MNNYNKNHAKRKSYKKSFVDTAREIKRKETKQKKQFKSKLVRKHLRDLLDMVVPFSAVVSLGHVRSTMSSQKPVLIEDCVVNKNHYVDHLWVELCPVTRAKLLKIPPGSRIFFYGTVHFYTSKNESESGKIGMSKVTLADTLSEVAV